jgi:nitrite reductase/ring-hydroxylating ferredoxin subunit
VSAARPRETRIPLDQAPPPGRAQMIELGRHRIALFCLDGRFHALADRCPHRGAPLCSRGQVVRALEVRELRVRRYRVRTEGDELVVSL